MLLWSLVKQVDILKSHFLVHFNRQIRSKLTFEISNQLTISYMAGKNQKLQLDLTIVKACQLVNISPYSLCVVNGVF